MRVKAFNCLIYSGPIAEKKKFPDTKIMENQDIFQDKTCEKDVHSAGKIWTKNKKSTKRLNSMVAIGVDLSRKSEKLIGSFPSQVSSPPLQNGGLRVSPRKKIENLDSIRFIPMHF